MKKKAFLVVLFVILCGCKNVVSADSVDNGGEYKQSFYEDREGETKDNDKEPVNGDIEPANVSTDAELIEKITMEEFLEDKIISWAICYQDGYIIVAQKKDFSGYNVCFKEFETDYITDIKDLACLQYVDMDKFDGFIVLYSSNRYVTVIDTQKMTVSDIKVPEAIQQQGHAIHYAYLPNHSSFIYPNTNWNTAAGYYEIVLYNVKTNESYIVVSHEAGKENEPIPSVVKASYDEKEVLYVGNYYEKLFSGTRGQNCIGIIDIDSKEEVWEKCSFSHMHITESGYLFWEDASKKNVGDKIDIRYYHGNEKDDFTINAEESGGICGIFGNEGKLLTISSWLPEPEMIVTNIKNSAREMLGKISLNKCSVNESGRYILYGGEEFTEENGWKYVLTEGVINEK